jgi:hypothetical protein
MRNDDIVTRLREKYSGQLPICLEAADEIELLESRLVVYIQMSMAGADLLSRLARATVAEEERCVIYLKQDLIDELNMHQLKMWQLVDQAKQAASGS